MEQYAVFDLQVAARTLDFMGSYLNFTFPLAKEGNLGLLFSYKATFWIILAKIFNIFDHFYYVKYEAFSIHSQQHPIMTSRYNSNAKEFEIAILAS